MLSVMRTLVVSLAFALLYMCGSEPPLPAAEHGGLVVSVGAQPLELVTHADGAVEAYPLGESTARGPTTSVIVHVPGADSTVHPVVLGWDEPSGKFIGQAPVAPVPGPISVDVVIAGAPQHAEAPVFVVLAPVAPVIAAPPPPATVHVEAHAPRVEVHGPRVEVVEPARPGIVVVPPAPPRPVVVVPPPPPGPVVVVPGIPPPVVYAPGPPRPGVVVIEGDRDRHVDEHGGHWDHGRHGGGGPEWHGGGGGHGHGH
jgi:hypothetical protein